MLMRINNEAPSTFLKWQKKLRQSLDAYGVKHAHVYRGIGMSRSTWENRMRKFNFTAQEALAICKVLNGENK